MKKEEANSKKTNSGSLLVAWQVRERHCLVIGGGEVAFSRVEHLLRAGAKITVVAGQSDKGIHRGILDLHEKGLLHCLIERNYEPLDLSMYETQAQTRPQLSVNTKLEEKDFELLDEEIKNRIFAIVCCCIDDYELSKLIYYQCKILRLPANIADKPHLCDFYFGSMINKGSLQVMVSTNGKSPRLLRMVKDTIAEQLVDLDLDKAAENLGAIRKKLRETVVVNDDIASIDTRMQWIKDLTDLFTIKEWCKLNLSGAENASKVQKIVDFFPDLPPQQFDFMYNLR